jgi:hypothetical protein
MKRQPLDDSFKVNRNPVTLREIVLDKLRSAIMNFQLCRAIVWSSAICAIASASAARRCAKPCVTWSPKAWWNSPTPKARAWRSSPWPTPSTSMNCAACSKA